MVEEDSFYGSAMAVGRSYHKLGEVTLQMDENFVLTDDSDPDTPPQVYTAEELFAIRDRLIGEFKPYNTAVTVKEEKIISIYRKLCHKKYKIIKRRRAPFIRMRGAFLCNRKFLGTPCYTKRH